MAYRLIRFSANNAVELDAMVVIPNEHGCNREWLNANANGAALLLERRTTKDISGLPVDGWAYYEINHAVVNRVGTLQRAGIPTWLLREPNYIKEKFKYIAMLELTGAL